MSEYQDTIRFSLAKMIGASINNSTGSEKIILVYQLAKKFSMVSSPAGIYN